MPDRNWNERYATGETPWDSDVPDATLVAAVESGALTPGRTLEVGCGTGTNSLWLASQGFDVLGIDLSPLAIQAAGKRQGDASDACRFEVRDFLADPPDGPFDVVFDRGCFHVFDDAERQARFAAGVARLLGPGGRWLSLIGSTEGAARETGPPRRSVRDIAAAIEPVLEIVELRGIHFHLEREEPPAAWSCLARARATPAQPSTGA